MPVRCILKGFNFDAMMATRDLGVLMAGGLQLSASGYPSVKLLIDGKWIDAVGGRSISVLNPATGQVVGSVAYAEKPDLDLALAATGRGFEIWRKTSAFERYKLMRKAADLLRERTQSISRLLTLEQGKPAAEAKVEVSNAADIIDWFAEEGRRANGWITPARVYGVQQLSVKEPIGPVAAFTPWNFPINQVVRKLAAALGAGCSIIVKAPEETPASPAELIRVFVDAGIPAGVIGLVYGNPSDISEYLIPHPVIRKLTFTGSTVIGKHLAALAGQHMKRATMELGGHAPAIVFADADIEDACAHLARSKFRNAGQVCISPTRFLVQEAAYDEFVERFVALTKTIVVGDGLEPQTTMGPLANSRRLAAMDALVADAQEKGATLYTGGGTLSDKGNFFAPTVLTDVTQSMRVQQEEPFGPLAQITPFRDLEDAAREANRLPYGLASYAFTRSSRQAMSIAAAVETGMMSINHIGLGLPEVHFGGVKDSGYGSEGGPEAIQAYLNTKFISLMPL
jgi:succinate-semialdehyde dehydrogenase/glutarate-semialdehyde dehydrogenase